MAVQWPIIAGNEGGILRALVCDYTSYEPIYIYL